MTPIVHGLETEYAEQVEFRLLNARDSAEGQAQFSTLGLPGHPSFLVFDAQGTEVYRAFGLVTEDALRQAITAVLP